MGFARLAMPAGFGGLDIAALYMTREGTGQCFTSGDGQAVGRPGQGFHPGVSGVEGDHRADTHIGNRRFFRQTQKMSSRTQG